MGSVLHHCCGKNNQPSHNINKTTSPPISKISNREQLYKKSSPKKQSNIGSVGLTQLPQNPKNVDKNHAMYLVDSVTQPNLNTQQSVNINKPADNYQFFKCLGVGPFGKSVHVTEKKSKKCYVMKAIDKFKLQKKIVLQSQLIQKLSQNNFFVNIKETFETNDKIYIIMEHIKQGQLLYYLKKNILTFTQNLIKQILVEVISAIEVLHSTNIIYRQLKPQNILITQQGHIKINDYCLSKIIDDSENNEQMTFIGIQQYMAPQALSGKYDVKLDLWAIGVLMYQLKFGTTPFVFSKLKDNYTSLQRLQNLKQEFKSFNIQQILQIKKNQVSQQYFNILKKLLVRNPKERISLEQLKRQPFFININWETIKKRQNPPPIPIKPQYNEYKFKDPQQFNRTYISTNIQNNHLYLYKFEQKSSNNT